MRGTVDSPIFSLSSPIPWEQDFYGPHHPCHSSTAPILFFLLLFLYSNISLILACKKVSSVRCNLITFHWLPWTTSKAYPSLGHPPPLILLQQPRKALAFLAPCLLIHLESHQLKFSDFFFHRFLPRLIFPTQSPAVGFWTWLQDLTCALGKGHISTSFQVMEVRIVIPFWRGASSPPGFIWSADALSRQPLGLHSAANLFTHLFVYVPN